MIFVSRTPDNATAASGFAPLRLFALLSALLLVVIPTSARSDIYKWTDEQGKINISNVPPPSVGKAKTIEVVLKEAAPSPGAAHAATEQALLARIESLERQLQSRQYAPQLPPVPAPAPYGSYYPPAPPPPPAPSYYGSYPGYAPSYYYPAVSAYAVYPARTYYSQPAFTASHGGHAHAGGGHRGRR